MIDNQLLKKYGLHKKYKFLYTKSLYIENSQVQININEDS